MSRQIRTRFGLVKIATVMKIYTHNYTKPSKAESLLYEAQQLLARESNSEALQRINEARELLGSYLAKDNIVEDGDALGFIKQSEIFDDMQIYLIRDTFAKMLDSDTYSPHVRDYLDIINICQVQTGCPEFRDMQHYLQNRKNFWGEVTAP